MCKRCVLIGLALLLFLVLSSVCASAAYRAGDVVYARYPQSGYNTNVGTDPSFVRWALKNPAGGIVFEEDHQLTYKRATGFLTWEWYDDYSIAVPGFPETGTWTLEGTLFSTFGPITGPEFDPYRQTVDVDSPDPLGNLFAPYYISIATGPLTGRFNLVIPVHPWLFVIVIVSLIVLFVVVKMIGSVGPAPSRAGKK